MTHGKRNNKLLSLIGLPLQNIGDGFITFAQTDVHGPRLYEICLDDNSGQENLNLFRSERQKMTEELT